MPREEKRWNGGLTRICPIATSLFKISRGRDDSSVNTLEKYQNGSEPRSQDVPNTAGSPIEAARGNVLVIVKPPCSADVKMGFLDGAILYISMLVDLSLQHL